jgi:hypothetical protein
VGELLTSLLEPALAPPPDDRLLFSEELFATGAAFEPDAEAPTAVLGLTSASFFAAVVGVTGLACEPDVVGFDDGAGISEYGFPKLPEFPFLPAPLFLGDTGKEAEAPAFEDLAATFF